MAVVPAWPAVHLKLWLGRFQGLAAEEAVLALVAAEERPVVSLATAAEAAEVGRPRAVLRRPVLQLAVALVQLVFPRLAAR